MSNTSFLSREELSGIGFNKTGKNVLISRNASFYSPEKIIIGDNVRIDDFCILSGNIHIGSYVHISAYVALYGGHSISIQDFSGISPRTTVFSASDDFNGDWLIGPMIPGNFRNIINGPVNIGKYVQIGAGNIILPNVSIGEGAVTGAMSLINKDLDTWHIYFGIPAKKKKERSKNLLKYIEELR